MFYNLYDTRNNLYRLRLDKKGRPIVLGSGGQGSVFLVEGNKNIVIKALTDNEGNIIKDEKKYRQYELEMLKVVSVEHVNYVARPLIMLQAPYCGYVMLFMSGLQPIVNTLLPRKFRYDFVKAIEDVTQGSLDALRNCKKEIDKINESNREEWDNYLKTIEKLKLKSIDIDQERFERKKSKCAEKKLSLQKCLEVLYNYEKKSNQLAFIGKFLDGNIKVGNSIILEYFNEKSIDCSRKILYVLIKTYLNNFDNSYHEITSDKGLEIFYKNIEPKLYYKSIVGAFINNVVSFAIEKQKTIEKFISKKSEMKVNSDYQVNDSNRVDEHELWNFILFAGGLQKRYFVLLRLASILKNLYNKGLVYGDLSPSNIFVSERSKDHEVWLIDTDNLRYASKITYTIGTPTYRAPEIARTDSGARNTFYSDWYSFALFAYEYLTLSKPFMGKLYFNKCEDSSWDDELETGNEDIGIIMEKGELAYVDDPEDKSNEKCCGLEIESVMTERLRMLFRAMFSLEGRNNPKERPSIITWCEALEEAILYLKYRKCEEKHSFLGRKCPMCNGRLTKKENKYYHLSAVKYIYEWDETGHYYLLLGKEPYFKMRWSWPKVFADRKKIRKIGLPKRLLEPLSDSNEILYNLFVDETGFRFQKTDKEGNTFIEESKDSQNNDILKDTDGFVLLIKDKQTKVPVASLFIKEDNYEV